MNIIYKSSTWPSGKSSSIPNKIFRVGNSNDDDFSAPPRELCHLFALEWSVTFATWMMMMTLIWKMKKWNKIAYLISMRGTHISSSLIKYRSRTRNFKISKHEIFVVCALRNDQHRVRSHRGIWMGEKSLNARNIDA